MFNEIQQQIDELKAKKKLTGADRARLKVLERQLKQSQKDDEVEAKSKTNVFATEPTTKINPLPIRFSGGERIGLTELANDIKSDCMELVITELGSKREINDTKLVRAAVYLLKQHSHEEIVEAIKQVKLNMIR
ncbi:hypothetical protein L1D34_23100 [Vibrio mediterranei]|uniref:hypothetical protein n=1 Tax=Vibrio mediterranei TaxID=689 RepID=UPI00148C48C6|nr:hypothetical protein [Vibrio mediterranei]MCG9627725.1 hypothetical protein [Vibrio mediterranei]MCG9659722.1 hypothetical protein [Vibrio mediterranei]NOI26503.1 hypothetical protein [Vibrio mediterranei]